MSVLKLYLLKAFPPGNFPEIKYFCKALVVAVGAPIT